jgi:hypothetical protein
VRNNRTGRLERAITPDGIYKLVRAYSAALGFEIGAHALRATAATNALDHAADIAKVQEWLGHANIATTRIYDHRRTRPEDSPTFKVAGSERINAGGRQPLARYRCIRSTPRRRTQSTASWSLDHHGVHRAGQPVIRIRLQIWRIALRGPTVRGR